MSSAGDWATAIRCSDILLRGHQRAIPLDEPTLLVHRIASNAMLCGGPTEHFSQDMPVWLPKTPGEDGLRPIDVLYGCYDATTHSIDIFVNQISKDASTFGAEPDELLEVVRIHEHAHAVVHLGTRADDIHKRLSSVAGGNRTEWSTFLAERTSWFAAFPAELHEFLAQGLTYAALSHLSESRKSERLREVFEGLEAKQSPHYKLPVLVKGYAARADWPLVLDAARGVVDVCREQDFTLSAGLVALVCSVAEPHVAGGAPQVARP